MHMKKNHVLFFFLLFLVELSENVSMELKKHRVKAVFSRLNLNT